MDDDAACARHHVRQEQAVEADGRQKIVGQFLLPLLLRERRKSAGRGGRASQHVDEDVDAAEALGNGVGERSRAVFGGQIGRNEKGVGQRIGS